MLSRGKIAATGHPIALTLMRGFDALASPRQGTLRGSVRRRHGCLVSAWSICGDRGLGLSPTASALPSQCYCGPERNDGPRRLRRRKRPSDLAASLNHPRRTNSSSEQLIARCKCVNRIYISGRYSLSAAMIACQKSIPRHATTRMRRIRPLASRAKVLSSCELSRSGSLMRNYSVARQRAKLTRH
jgi:hypothetical protein